DAVSFLANPVYRPQLADTKAAAVVLAARDSDACPVACLIHPQPYLVYARIAEFLNPPPTAVAGVHPSAVVAPSARVAASAQVDATAVIGARTVVGDGAVIGAGTVLGDDVVVGAATRLAPR